MSGEKEPTQEVTEEESENPSLRKILEEHTMTLDGKRYFPWDAEIKPGFPGDYGPKEGAISIEEQDEETLMRTIKEHALRIGDKTYLDSDVDHLGWVGDREVPKEGANPIEIPEDSPEK